MAMDHKKVLPAARQIDAPTDWNRAHVLSVRQFGRESLTFLCEVATLMRTIVEQQGGCELLKHKVLANVFYEPSTRTSCSFASAMQRLGGSVLQVNESTSSAVKGETLSDTFKCLSCYADAVVLRHPQQGSAAIAAGASDVPVLNAGDGVGEHPTQALLDLYTIVAELGPGLMEGRPTVVTLLGDLKNGRTVHSLAKLLSLFPGVTLNFVAPEELSMPAGIVSELAVRGISFSSTTSLDGVLPSTDVLYVTRVQKERFSSLEEYERLKAVFIVTRETMARAKPVMVVMHPLPRVGEIDVEVDADPRAAYFRQMRYGLFVRMALLALCCGVERAAIEKCAAAAAAAEAGAGAAV